MRPKRIVVMGAGGMAREIEWLIRTINAVEPSYEFLGYVVSDLTKSSPYDSREAILGDYAWIEKNLGSVDAVALGIGSPAARLKVAGDLTERFPGLETPSLVHPTAIIDRASAKLGPGAQICAGVVATVNVTLEAFALCNFGCTVGHETVIGRGSVVNPGANLSGGVVVGEGVLIGTGAQVLQYCRIGDRATVGGGAVVRKDVAPATSVVGVPARPLNARRL